MSRPTFDIAINYWLPILGRSSVEELRWLWREDLVLRYPPVTLSRRRLFRLAAPFRLYHRAPDTQLRRQQMRAAYDALRPTNQTLVFYYFFTESSFAYVGLAGDEWVVDDSVDLHHAEWDIWYSRPTSEYGHVEVRDRPIRWWWRGLLQNRHPSDLDFLYSYKRLVAAFPSHRWPNPAPVH